MEEEEHTDRKRQLAMLYQRINKIKNELNEGNAQQSGLCGNHLYHYPCVHSSKSHHHFVFFADDTDNIKQIIGSNSPESCRSYLLVLEKKGDPHMNRKHLTRLIDFYTRVFSNMPLGKHCEDESYARMLVRFAELKA